ncbi:MAG: cytochrome c [Bacteroidia bacterium]
MKSKFLISLITLLIASHLQLFAYNGSDLFTSNCVACHTIGKGKLVGPDLKGVESYRSEKWLLKWIKSSQSLVQAGDTAAVKLFADNSNIPMPDQALNEDQIKAILNFIKVGGAEVVATSTNTASPQNTKVASADSVSSQNTTVNPAIQKKIEPASSGSSLLNMFSFTEYLLFFLVLFMLLIIYVLGTSLKRLMEK